jgi:hypothetical protein
LIFLAALFIYQANLRPIASLDSLPTALLPFSILIDRSLRLDRFVLILHGDQPGIPYYFRAKEGHYYSTYPIALPVLLTPLYIPVFALVNPASWTIGEQILFVRMILEKLVAGLLTAASIAFFSLLLDRVTSRRNALLLAGAFAFGTSAWAISSQALWLCIRGADSSSSWRSWRSRGGPRIRNPSSFLCWPDCAPDSA